MKTLSLIQLVIGLLLAVIVFRICLFSFSFNLSNHAHFPKDIHLAEIVQNIPAHELLCDPLLTPDFRAMSKSGYQTLLSAAEFNSTDNFTVLLLTYDRFKSFRQVTTHYACMPFVDRVILLWANQEVAAPEIESFEEKCRNKIIVKQLAFNHLTLRFTSLPEIRTSGVLNVDDDALPKETYLLHAFRVWKNHPWALVGPYSRAHQGTNSSSMQYAVTWQNGHSLILTGFVFLHREYLRLFNEKLPSDIREQIDTNRNCEDIFMNFLVKQHCRCSGVARIYYETPDTPKDLVWKGSLSLRPKHYIYRSECLRNYTKLFGESVNLTISRCVY